jgi:transcription initiation factor TFIIIB Brf1 subunit/transcription initiation factor TFIIB
MNDENLNELFSFIQNSKSVVSNKFENDTICVHKNILSIDEHKDVCPDCGLEIQNMITDEQEWRYYGNSDTKYSSDPSRVQYRKEAEKGIVEELNKFRCISLNIKTRANDLYREVTKGSIKRGRSRLSIIFACVYNAYLEREEKKTSEELRILFNLERREASRALTFFKTNHKSRASMYISSYYFIPLILSKFNANDSHEENIKNIYNLLENKDLSKINGSNPKSISAGLIYYYLINIDKIIDPDVFAKIVGLSKITILKISKYIATLINEEEDEN